MSLHVFLQPERQQDGSRASKLTSLTSLDLGVCRLPASGMAALRQLTALTNLNLRGCRGQTERSLAALGALTALRYLNLYYTRLKDHGLAKLRPLTALTRLHPSGCTELTGEGLVALQPKAALASLDLSNNYRLADAGLLHGPAARHSPQQPERL